MKKLLTFKYFSCLFVSFRLETLLGHPLDGSMQRFGLSDLRVLLRHGSELKPSLLRAKSEHRVAAVAAPTITLGV